MIFLSKHHLYDECARRSLHLHTHSLPSQAMIHNPQKTNYKSIQMMWDKWEWRWVLTQPVVVCVCVCVLESMWVSSCSAMRTFIRKSCKILARLVYFMPSHSNLFWLSKRLIFPMPQWYFKYSRSLSTVFNDTLLQYNVLAFSSLASNCGRIEIWKYVIFEVSCIRSWANKKYTPQFCSLGSVRFF